MTQHQARQLQKSGHITYLPIGSQRKPKRHLNYDAVMLAICIAMLIYTIVREWK